MAKKKRKKPKRTIIKQPPFACRLCKYLLNDDYFKKEYKTSYVCEFDGVIEPKLIGFGCEEMKLGKWQIVEYLKKLEEGMHSQLVELFNSIQKLEEGIK